MSGGGDVKGGMAAGVIVDLLERGHAVRFRAHGDSMHPVIRAEDVLHVEPRRDFRAGDVVLLLADRGLTAHRVIVRKGDWLLTRGDNAPGDDEPMDLSRVLGIVTAIERDGVTRGVRREAFFLRWARRVRRFGLRR
jgi:SOS-response transcriptional repressor LexA